MMNRRFSAATAGLVAVAVVGSMLAHPDDPKIKYQRPRYEGPGWRGGENNLNPHGFPADGVDLLAWVTIPEFGNSSSAMDCWGYTSPSGREYALLCLNNGTGIVEITDPANPVVLGRTNEPDSGWHDVKTFGHYAYSVNESSGGVYVIDLNDIDNGNFTLVGNVSGPGTGRTHNVVINEDSGYLYRTGGSGNGLRIYDLNNTPQSPQFVGEWQDRYVHDAQVVSYTDGPYAGKEIAFCCAGLDGGWTATGLSIVDVTDKSNPVTLAHLQYDQNAEYSHQGWLTADRQYFYLDDELDEYYNGGTTNTRIIDVSDLSNPVRVGTYTSGTTAIDHNMYVKGNTVFQANYTSGLRVFDATDPLNPQQVGYFDTHPQNDNAEFLSLWSCYPYFNSGVILGSDRTQGLFIWRLTPQTDLDSVTIARGTIISGDVDSIRTSDDVELQTRSGFGSLLTELHVTDLRVAATTGINSPSTIDLSIESHLDSTSGTATILLLNQTSGKYESVGSYAINSTESTQVISGIPAGSYVDDAGQISVSIKHVVHVPFLAYQFDSRFDFVGVEVN